MIKKFIRKWTWTLIGILSIYTSGAGQEKEVIDYGNNPNAGTFITVDKAKIYFETYGAGQPMIIFHGNGGSIRGRADQINEYSKKYKVIVMDNRCHGKSDCPAGEVTYEQMASDIQKILNHLKVRRAYAWGHSDGAIIGLLTLIEHPGYINKLLASGGNLRPDTTAIDPEVLPIIQKMKEFAQTDSIQMKRLKLLTEQPNIPISELRRIEADVLIMAGDRDIVRHRHTLEIFENIPNALLSILPGTTHMVFTERKEWFNQILYDFFDNPQSRLTTVELMKKQFKDD